MAQSNNDTTAAKVLSYIVFDWLTKHMDINCYADVITTADEPKGPKPLFLCQRPRLPPPPLHFKSTAQVIQERHYSLELQKEPYFYWMKELNVKWVPHLDAKTPPDFFPTIITNNVTHHPTGFYRVVTEVSEDYEYLVRLQITRV